MPEKITLRKPTDISTLVEAGILPEECVALLEIGDEKYLANKEVIQSLRQELPPEQKLLFSSRLSHTIPKGTYHIAERTEWHFPDTLDDRRPKLVIWHQLLDA